MFYVNLICPLPSIKKNWEIYSAMLIIAGLKALHIELTLPTMAACSLIIAYFQRTFFPEKKDLP
jgi:hypothetical protein